MASDPKKRERGEQEKLQKELRKKIKNCFEQMGFTYLKTEKFHVKLQRRTVEVDSVFLFENVILFCEDTITNPSHQKDHLRKTKEAVDAIEDDFATMLHALKDRYEGKFKDFDSYPESSYKRFYLYVSNRSFDGVDRDRFSPLKLIDIGILNYFSAMSSAIYKSARFELFGYLGLEASAIGSPSTGSKQNLIDATIITPEKNANFGNGVRMVSFMMAPNDLLECGYVLRKDGWKKDVQVYQRFTEKGRIKSIRQFIAKNKKPFVNNIIVGLPDSSEIVDEGNQPIKLEDISTYRDCKLRIKKEYNSICIIDGQHRVYAHHEGKDVLERDISSLRNQLHLLVTGFIFPPKMSPRDRAEFEATIFIEINKEAKKVSNSVLQYINMWMKEHSSVGVAREVIEKLNSGGVFKGLFQLSEIEPARIKITSIISFALSRLVSIDKPDDNSTLVYYWDGEKDLLKADKIKTPEGEDAFNSYINFCTSIINSYFSALRQVRKSDWNDQDSKIFSVTSINGFLLALKASLPSIGLKERNNYVEFFNKLDISFKKSSIPGEGFPYSSSQYAKFSRQILEDCFGIAVRTDNDSDNVPTREQTSV